MNQTQTRSPRKRWLSLLLAVILMIGLLPISAFASNTGTQADDSGSGYEYNIMFLDCGRKYYSVDSIKKIIDNASAAGFNYIQLAVGNDGLRFLLDDMSLTVNGTTYSSQQVSDAIHKGNEAYYNFDVDELTQSEMDEIITYAASKGMGVIPCVNTPGHMDAILSAATSLTRQNCSYSGSVRTIDVTNNTAVAFTQALLQKYIRYFAGKGCKIFNMGADEYANDVNKTPHFSDLINNGGNGYKKYIEYLNTVAGMIKKAGMKPMAFNDGIYYNKQTGYGTIDSDIIVCYWSGGWSGYDVAPASFLKGQGFRLINTHGDYYWVLGGTQCSADKAKEFDYKSFPAKQGDNGTIDNPSGSMFCIWADYPGAETEASVISKTAATIVAFGGTLPEVKTQTNIKSSSGSTTLSVNGSTELSISDGSSATWTVSPAGVIELTANTNAANGSVVGSSVIARAIAKGTATVTATTADGKAYTMELTVENPNEKDITVVVGGTETVTVSGNHEDEYTTENPNVATVTTKYSESTKQVVSETNATEIESGSQYLIALDRGYDNTNSRKILYNEESGNGLKLSGYNEKQLWTITSNSSKSPYTANVKGVNGTSITGIDRSAATLSTSGSVTLNYNESGYWEIYSTSNGTTYYLNQYGGSNSSMAAGYSDSPSYDVGSRWRLFKVTPAATEQTTITFTGVSVGETSVVIGGVKYNIHVTAEDLTKVTPLTIEYWITNSRLTGVSDNSNEKVIKATDDGIATETGVETSALVAPTGTKDGRHQEYWQTKILDVEKTNTSTSGTELQTTASGDDETLNGSAFSKVRYWGGVWQVYTTEWVNVDRTTVTVETYTGDKNQLVAYYMEVVDITNKDGETEMHVNAADWGTKGDGTGNWGYTPESDRCSVSIQMVYEDGSTNPSDITADALKSKTFVYGYWNGGRGLGTMIFNGQGDYQILKVTAETGTMQSSASGSNTVTVTSFTWSNNEEIVWTGGPADSASIGNPAGNPSYEAPLDNLAWNTSSGNRNNAILIRVYVKSVPKADSLHVNYFVQGSTTPFYDYAINVKANTVFDSAFRRVEDPKRPDTGYLENATVTNYYGASQTVQSDLSKMTEIEAQYRYCDYRFVDATRSDDGKTVNLYYTFSSTRNFVVDFGLPLVIRPADVNDRLSGNGVNLTGIEVTNKTSFASITTDASKNITYSLNKMIDQMDTFSVQYTGQIKNDQGSLQSGTVKYTLTIIPASNVYYEDSLASFTNGSGVAAGADWSTDDQATADQKSATQALEQLGSSGIYGYDAAYNSSSTFSMGTAHKVTVTSEMLANWKTDDTTSAWPTASFTFTGTGFDVISLTDNTSGAILVKVTGAGADNKDFSKNYLVNNYYGYNKVVNEDGSISWVVSDSNEPNALYQIPVMKVDVPYGAYNVTIQVFYNQIFDKTHDKQYNFWLDAIRVYNPMGKDYDYTLDDEGYPQYIKLHDALAKDGTATVNDQLLFIDGAEHATIEQYANFGPNNEVYLANGQAITFKVPADQQIASIQIGAKAPDGTAKMVVNSDDGSARTLNTATEMYYEISKTGKQFTIASKGEGILSLTNLKITYTDKNHEEVKLESLTAEEQANAVAMVQALFAAPVETFQPERFDVSWGGSVRAGRKATLTVKASEDVDAITVDGVTVSSYTTRTERTGWGWWSPKVTYRVFTYTITATATADYQVCAVNSAGISSEPVIATLTVRPATWWNWWF